MSVIVTGASGQLGRLVIDHLLATVPASEVTAVARDPAKAGDLAARGVTVAVADYNSPESFDGLLRGGDRVLLISGNEMHLDRVAQHKAVLGAAVKAGVALFAYTSVLGLQGGPVNDDHRATEDAIRASGVPYSLLRNGLYHEMATMNIPAALERGALVRAAGDGRLASASRADYAAAAAAVLTSGGHEDTVLRAVRRHRVELRRVRRRGQHAVRAACSLPCRDRRGVRGDAVRRRAARPAPAHHGRHRRLHRRGGARPHHRRPVPPGRPATPVADAIAAALAG